MSNLGVSRAMALPYARFFAVALASPYATQVVGS